MLQIIENNIWNNIWNKGQCNFDGRKQLKSFNYGWQIREIF